MTQSEYQAYLERSNSDWRIEEFKKLTHEIDERRRKVESDNFSKFVQIKDLERKLGAATIRITDQEKIINDQKKTIEKYQREAEAKILFYTDNPDFLEL
jgi:replicative DNA helicase